MRDGRSAGSPNCVHISFLNLKKQPTVVNSHLFYVLWHIFNRILCMISLVRSSVTQPAQYHDSIGNITSGTTLGLTLLLSNIPNTLFSTHFTQLTGIQ